MFVTRHNSVTDPQLRERLWRLYALAFRPISELVVCREMMCHHEFEQLVADPVNRTGCSGTTTPRSR